MTVISRSFYGLLLLLVLLTTQAVAQKKEQVSNLWKAVELQGQVRNYWMSTINKDSLKDFAAGAVGGKLMLKSGKYKGISFGFGWYTSLNLGISDLEKADPVTGKESRYELGLFDVTDPSKDFISLLGEAYIKWQQNKQEVTAGRMLFKSPLLNPQDGRMIPTLVQGLWYQNARLEKLNFGLGYFNSIAPRSTSRWYKIENSVGHYPQGVGRYGHGNYLGNIHSPGLVIGSAKWVPSSKFQLQLWDYAFLNVFNSFYTDAKWIYPLAENKKNISAAFQYIYQKALAQGGNQDLALSYFPKDLNTHIIGIKAGYDWQQYGVLFAYNRIFGGGQFLFPREWGRDPLFTFQKRERQEGYGDTHAFLLRGHYKEGKRWLVEAGAGYYRHPDVTNRRLNKYAQSSYYQLNLDIFYNPPLEALKNLQAELLIAYKIGDRKVYDNPNYVINKIDMAVFNLILNYTFALKKAESQR